MLHFIYSAKDADILSPSYNGLQFWALMRKNLRPLYIIAHTCALIFIITQYIELCIVRNDLELTLKNLSVTMLSTLCVFKGVTYVYWEKKWLKLIEFVSTLELMQLVKRDLITKKTIAEYTKYSRKVTFIYRLLSITTVLLLTLAPLFTFLVSSPEHRAMYKNGSMPYPEIMSSWVPFNRSNGIGCWMVILLHSMSCFYGSSVVASFDCNTIIIMSFFAGQWKILSINCARMFDDAEQLTCDETINRIKECHYHHLNLVKYSSLLNSLLSPVMFLYVIICSFMICASATQLNMRNTGNMARIWIVEYLVALIAQLFLYCWHSNEVLYRSGAVEDSVYASTWYTQNVRIRRSVLLLRGQLRKSVVFTAGPFTKLDVATFVTILKASYSYYTLLRQKGELNI